MTDQTKPEMPEIDFEKEAMHLYSFIFHRGSTVQQFDAIGQKPEVPDSSLVAQWLRSFTSRILSAERQGGWKKMEWRGDHYYCGEQRVGGYAGVYFDGMYHFESLWAHEKFMEEELTLPHVRLWVEQTVLSELNSLRSKEEEA